MIMSVKVTPKPKFKTQGVDFADVEVGGYFLGDDTLHIKLDSINQTAVDVATGKIYKDMCGIYVRPVDVVITWKQQ